MTKSKNPLKVKHQSFASSKDEALSLQRSAKACYITALVLLLVFIYKFFALEPSALDSYTMSLEKDHFRFVTGKRWYLFSGSFVFLAMGLLSVKKSNRL